MRHITPLLSLIAAVSVYFAVLVLPHSINAQSQDKADLSDIVSLRPQASVFFAGKKEYGFDDIRNNPDISFVPLSGLKENMGFSDESYWLRFPLENPNPTTSHYFLET